MEVATNGDFLFVFVATFTIPPPLYNDYKFIKNSYYDLFLNTISFRIYIWINQN